MKEYYMILTQEPFVGSMPQDILKMICNDMPESLLALLMAEVSDKVGSIMHQADDHSDPWVVYALDQWETVASVLRDRIFSILISEGILTERPKQGWYSAIIPFMERNGYHDGCGWWVREDEA